MARLPAAVNSRPPLRPGQHDAFERRQPFIFERNCEDEPPSALARFIECKVQCELGGTIGGDTLKSIGAATGWQSRRRVKHKRRIETQFALRTYTAPKQENRAAVVRCA